MKIIIKKAVDFFGLSISRKNRVILPITVSSDSVTNSSSNFADISEKSKMIFEECIPYTLLGLERIDAIVSSIDYLCENSIAGDIVECGVWKGGSVYAAVRALVLKKSFERKIFLFDVFEVDAMFATAKEIAEDMNFQGTTAREALNKGMMKRDDYKYQIDEVMSLLKSTGYPPENIIFKVGRVEDTLPCAEIEKIALLRLDTDWYDSTKHELVHLFPKLVQKGVLLIDDYGHWQGCRKAVDEYIAENKLQILLNRTDFTGRSAVKI